MSGLDKKLKEIEGHSGYFVNRLGEIYSNRQGKLKLKTQRLNNSGYYRVTLENKQVFVHRILANTYLPNSFSLNMVNHKDGDKKNNSLDNLEWVSGSQNALHALSTGLRGVLHGERNGNAKLTEKDVIDIKQRLANREFGTKLAREYGVAHGRIYDIKHGRGWTRLAAK